MNNHNWKKLKLKTKINSKTLPTFWATSPTGLESFKGNVGTCALIFWSKNIDEFKAKRYGKNRNSGFKLFAFNP